MVTAVPLTHAQALDLDERFSVVPPRDTAADELGQQTLTLEI